MNIELIRRTLPSGASCHTPPADASMTGFVIEEQGDWFEDELPFLRRLVQPGWHIVDVGASYGTYGLGLAPLCAGGSVTLVEPHPKMAEAVSRSVARMTGCRLDVRECALGAAEGEALLTDPKDPELAHLSADGVHEVDVVRLDDMVPAGAALDLLKIDVEGDVLAVLAGAGRVLAEQRPIVQFTIRQSGRYQARACAELMAKGYLIHRVLPGIGVLTPLLPGEGLDPFVLNAIALPEGRLHDVRRRGLVSSVVDETSPLPEGVMVQSIIERLAASPWIAGCSPVWAPNAIVPGWDHQRRAVAMQALAEDASLPVEQRAACLQHAVAASRRALAAGMNGSRLLTAVRVLLAAGLRGEACRTIDPLQALVQASDADAATACSEPFLPPLVMHDAMRATSLPDLVRALALEVAAFVPVYSAFFQGAARLPLFERLDAMPLRSERAQRAAGLLRRANSRQSPIALRL